MRREAAQQGAAPSGRYCTPEGLGVITTMMSALR